MSSISARGKSGIYYYHTRIFDPITGKRTQISKSLKTRDHAEAKRLKEERDREYLPYQDPDALPFLIKQYIADRQTDADEGRIAQSTVKGDVFALQGSKSLTTFMQTVGEVYTPNTVPKNLPVRFRRWRMKEHGVSGTTADNQLRSISAFFSWLVQQGKMATDSNPFGGFTIEQTPSRPIYLNANEFDDIKDRLKSLSDNAKRVSRYNAKHASRYNATTFQTITLVLALTGMRISEVRRLKWKRGRRDSGTQAGNNYSFIGPKEDAVTIYSKGSSRVVPFAHVMPYLRHRDRSTTYVFESTQNSGQPYSDTYCIRKVSDVLTDLGYEDFTAHDLRHGFITDRLRNDVTAYKIGQVVGHSSEYILNTYSHLVPDDLTGVMEGV